MDEEFYTLTRDEIRRAFIAWEVDFRLNPDKFGTPEDDATTSVAEVADRVTDKFLECLAVTL